MLFAQKNMFHLFWILIAFSFLLRMWHLRRRRVMRKFAGKDLLESIVSRFDEKMMVWKNVILLCVFVFCILALARPQWGFQWREIKRKGSEILLVVDVSKSMLTGDVKPDRLGRSKLAIRDLVRKLHGDRLGIIAFAGDAFLVCPLTSDYSGFLLSLNDLSVDIIPRGGTNISKAIEEAIRNYGDKNIKQKAIIIITDGDDLEGDSLGAAKKARDAGIKIFTVGIGTKEGELIQVKNANGNFEFLKNSEGNFVKSRLNEKLLREISLTTGGVYVKAQGSQFGIDVIYDHYLSRFERREFESKMEKKHYERFQIPLLIAFVLLIFHAFGTDTF